MLASVHAVCSWVLVAVSIGIGMKSFDSPHALTATEKVWLLVGRIMLLPIAEPLQRLGKGPVTAIVSDPGYGAGVRSLAPAVWFFGAIVLNSVLWAVLITWAYSRLSRRIRRVAARRTT